MRIHRGGVDKPELNWVGKAGTVAGRGLRSRAEPRGEDGPVGADSPVAVRVAEVPNVVMAKPTASHDGDVSLEAGRAMERKGGAV